MSIEEVIEQKLREVVAPLQKEISELRSIIEYGHHKPSLTVKEAAKLASVGQNRIREWARLPDFPKIQETEGGKITIPTRRFLEWYEKNAPELNDSA